MMQLVELMIDVIWNVPLFAACAAPVIVMYCWGSVRLARPVRVAKPDVTPATPLLPTLATVAPEPETPVGTRCWKSTSHARELCAVPSQLKFCGAMRLRDGGAPCGAAKVSVSHRVAEVFPPTIVTSGSVATTPGCRFVRYACNCSNTATREPARAHASRKSGMRAMKLPLLSAGPCTRTRSAACRGIADGSPYPGTPARVALSLLPESKNRHVDIACKYAALGSSCRNAGASSRMFVICFSPDIRPQPR